MEMLAGEITHQTFFRAISASIISRTRWDVERIITRECEVSMLVTLRGVDGTVLGLSEWGQFSTLFLDPRFRFSSLLVCFCVKRTESCLFVTFLLTDTISTH